MEGPVSRAALLAIYFLAVSSVNADPIAITNPGFEDPVAATGTKVAGVPPGWNSVTGEPVGVWDISSGWEADFPAGPPEGDQVGYMWTQTIWQATSEVMEPNTTYTLRVDFTHAEGFTSELKLEIDAVGFLMESVTVLPDEPGIFQTGTVVFNVGVAHPFMGSNLRILLRSETNEAVFDNVRFDKTPNLMLPEDIYMLGSDRGSEAFTVFDKNGHHLGTWGVTNGDHNCPFIKWGPNNELFASCWGTNSIRHYTSTGVDLGAFATDQITQPAGITFDSNGNVYLANNIANNILRYNLAGDFIDVFVTGLSVPREIEFDSQGNLWVADGGGRRVLKFDPDGVQIATTPILSDPTQGGSAIFSPYGLAIDENDNIYVANEIGQQIQYFDPDGALLGVFATGPGGSASTLGFGPDGNLYLSAFDADVHYWAPDGTPLGVFATTRNGLHGTRNMQGMIFPNIRPELVDVIGLSDVNGNGFGDIAVVIPGSTIVKIRDGDTDAEISDTSFGADPAIAVEAIDDINANGTQEIAVLAVRPSGQMRVTIRDSLDGAFVNTVFFGTTFAGEGMAVLPDLDNSGAQELAVLGRTDAGNVRVQARDSLTDDETSTTFYGTTIEPISIAASPDQNANSSGEIAVHGKSTKTGHGRTLMRDSATAQVVGNYFFGTAYEPIKQIMIGDVNADGRADLAQLARREDTGQVRVQIRASSGGPVIANGFIGTEKPVDLIGIGDANNNGSPDVAVLVERANGGGKIIIRDGATGAFIRNVFVGKVIDPVAVTLVDDLNASGDPELVALGKSSDDQTIWRVQIKDSITGDAIKTIDFP